jgi:Holliday junction resolvase
MKKSLRGYTNEIRTVDFLAKNGWVAVRAGGSKGMLDLDVLAYNVTTGMVKHIQAKSNKHYTKKDTEMLEMVRYIIKADNVSVELWDWRDGNQYPLITIFNMDSSTEKYSTDPLISPYTGGLK